GLFTPWQPATSPNRAPVPRSGVLPGLNDEPDRHRTVRGPGARVLYNPRPRHLPPVRSRMPPLKRLLRWFAIAILGLGVLGALTLATLYFVGSARLRDVEALRDIEMQEPLYVYARDGRLMALFGETRRYPVRIEE